MIIDEALREFGLSESEIKVYKASLELGLATVSSISKRSGIYRTLAYEVISKLISKGLMSMVQEGNKKHFKASSPKSLLSILKEKEEIINKAMPDLLVLERTNVNKPNITMFEGIMGIRTALNNTLSSNEILVFISNVEFLRLMKFFAHNFIKRREQKGIKVRLITDVKPVSSKNMTYKILKSKRYAGYWIYNNVVLFMNFADVNPIAVQVEDKDIANTMRISFEQMWNSL